jgi:energy-coupling factor transporter ATPase
MAKIISVKNLIFEYNDSARAIDGISFEIERGSFVAVAGANGSGKSTLAKLINGLYVPTSGEVIVDGMNTADDSHIWDIRSKVGMVFQNPDNQIVSSIVEDDVAFGPENLGIDPAEIRRRVDDALKEVGMYDARGKGAHQLSGGQKQRIAIAGVVAMRPDCIIFDEPTAMLDPRGRSKVIEIIRKLNAEGITVLLITHYMQEAMLADRLIVMKDGRIVDDDIPGRIFSGKARVKDAGLKMPPVFDLRNRLRSAGWEISDDADSPEKLADELANLFQRQ